MICFKQNYYLENVDKIICIQAWFRGISTRYRLKPNDSISDEENPQSKNEDDTKFEKSNADFVNMNDIDETQIESKSEVQFKNGATYTG